MQADALKDFYEDDATRFWNPQDGLIGRDLTIYPLLDGLKGSLLDYGAGAGSLLLNLALEPRFTALTGVDISENVLARIAAHWQEMSAKQELDPDRVKLMTPTNDSMPSISDGSIDVITSLDTIEHVLDPYPVLDEFHRIAAPNGTFIISVPNYGYIKHALTLMLGRQPITGGGEPVENWRTSGWDGWHLHTFTKESLNALLRDCGWTPVKWTGYGDKGRGLGLEILRKRFPALLSGALTVVCKKAEKPRGR
jgi:SAM-dependent methyltransferase